MNTPADKVVITITAGGWTIDASAAGQTVAERTGEALPDCVAFEFSGDDLYEKLPHDLAITLDSMDLLLMDSVISLMPDNA